MGFAAVYILYVRQRVIYSYVFYLSKRIWKTILRVVFMQELGSVSSRLWRNHKASAPLLISTQSARYNCQLRCSFPGPVCHKKGFHSLKFEGIYFNPGVIHRQILSTGKVEVQFLITRPRGAVLSFPNQAASQASKRR